MGDEAIREYIMNFNEKLRYEDGNLYRIKSGKIAGTKKGNGYIMITFNYVKMLVHRVIWEMHNGPIPEGYEIDHMNGIRSDNRIENLRLVTRSINNKNKRMQSNNTSGFTGVVFVKQRGKWNARVKENGIQKNIGSFSTAIEANEAREKYLSMRGDFTSRHGK
jgi:hypothetical protein